MIAERQTTPTRDLPPSPLPRLPRTAPRARVTQTDVRTPRPMGERGPRVVRRVRAFRLNSPMSAAVLAASFLVCLASLYVSAYARIAMQSVEKAELSRAIRAGAQRQEALSARVSELTLSSMVKERAMEMKMEPNSSQSTDLLQTSDSGNTLAAGNDIVPNVPASVSRKIIQ